MNEARLKELLDGFARVRIAVIGDFFLDKWLLIDRGLDEASIETGLTAYQVVGKRLCPGAAGTITNNLAALKVGEIYAVGFTGDDGEGYELIQGLKATGVKTDYMYKYEEVFTPTYIKPLFIREPQPEETHRLDIRNRAVLPEHIEDKIIESLYQVSDKVDAIIALDQVLEPDTGAVTGRVRETLAELGRTKPGLVIYADSRAYTWKFRDIIIKCNHLEAVNAVYPDWKGETDEAKIKECALVLAQRMGKPVFITCGGSGIVAAHGEKAVRIPAIQVEGPVDICGAGDSATAGIVSSLCLSASLEEAALVGNLAASITIQQIGTTGTAPADKVFERFQAYFKA